jgi:hypothetical protein
VVGLGLGVVNEDWEFRGLLGLLALALVLLPPWLLGGLVVLRSSRGLHV